MQWWMSIRDDERFLEQDAGRGKDHRGSAGSKLLYGLLLLIVVISVKVLVDVQQLADLGSRFENLNAHHLPEERLLGQLAVLTNELKTAVQFILNRDVADGEESRKTRIVTAMAESLNAYRGLYSEEIGDAEAKLLSRLEARYSELEKTTTNVVQLVTHGDPVGATALFLGPWERLHHDVVSDLAMLAEHENEQVVTAFARTQEKIRQARIASIVLAAVGIVLSVGLGAAVTVSLARPVAVIRRDIRRLIRGDPVAGSKAGTPPQGGSIAREFNTMVERLHDSVEDVCHEIKAPLSIIRGEAEVALRVMVTQQCNIEMLCRILPKALCKRAS